MKISEWFDPCVMAHVRAYKHLSDKGEWPKGFVPEGLEFPPGWQIIIQAKLAREWVSLILDDHD